LEQVSTAVPRELAKIISEGLKHGLSEDQIVKGMVSLGNFAEKVSSPDNPEEVFIKALWNEATNEEKEMISRIIFRVGKKRPH
jgi:cytochrome c-type biogenesis protein CcmH/NrfF